MDVMTDLRTATRGLHDRIEALPVCQAMAAGTVDRESLARLTGLMLRAAEALEAGLASVPAVAAVWPSTAGRAGALARDLEALGGEAPEAVDAVTDWVARVDELAAAAPAAWAGAGYVFEGSRMGSRVLLPRLAAALGVTPRPGVGLDYHLAAATDAGVWPQVRAALPALAGSPAAQAAMVAAAVATFEMMIALHADASAVPALA